MCAKPKDPVEVTVRLTAVGKDPLAVVKVIREITQLGLKDAKDLVDQVLGSPQVVQEQVTEEEALHFQDKLVAAGATVELDFE